jgi:hypothetical protein
MAAGDQDLGLALGAEELLPLAGFTSTAEAVMV